MDSLTSLNNALPTINGVDKSKLWTKDDTVVDSKNGEMEKWRKGGREKGRKGGRRTARKQQQERIEKERETRVLLNLGNQKQFLVHPLLRDDMQKLGHAESSVLHLRPPSCC